MCEDKQRLRTGFGGSYEALDSQAYQKNSEVATGHWTYTTLSFLSRRLIYSQGYLQFKRVD